MRGFSLSNHSFSKDCKLELFFNKKIRSFQLRRTVNWMIALKIHFLTPKTLYGKQCDWNLERRSLFWTVQCECSHQSCQRGAEFWNASNVYECATQLEPQTKHCHQPPDVSGKIMALPTSLIQPLEPSARE